MVAGIQGSRMNDQRAYLTNFPGLCKSEEVVDKLLANKKEDSALDDHFFEMLMRCQVSGDAIYPLGIYVAHLAIL